MWLLFEDPRNRYAKTGDSVIDQFIVLVKDPALTVGANYFYSSHSRIN